MIKCSTCGGGHIAGSCKCEQYKQAIQVQQYRETNSEDVEQVAKFGEAGEGRMRSNLVTC